MKLKETPAHFFENIYVTRNIIAIRQSYLLKECGWSESQIEQILDPEQVEPGKNAHSQYFMKPQKPFSFARKTDSHHRLVAIFIAMNRIPDSESFVSVVDMIAKSYL